MREGGEGALRESGPEREREPGKEIRRASVGGKQERVKATVESRMSYSMIKLSCHCHSSFNLSVRPSVHSSIHSSIQQPTNPPIQ